MKLEKDNCRNVVSKMTFRLSSDEKMDRFEIYIHVLKLCFSSVYF